MRKVLVTGVAALAGFAGTGLAGAGELAPILLSQAATTNFSGTVPAAAEGAPDVLLSDATLLVTTALRGERTNSPAKVAELIEASILPLFDFGHMTQLAVARNWALASPDQRRVLTAEFKALLVRTYSSALTNYRGQAIEYRPLKMTPGQTDVTVKSTVAQPGAERLTIDYDMQKVAAGWKVYDIKIAGISLITNYRTTFAQIIRDGGVDGLIKSLSAKNRELAG